MNGKFKQCPICQEFFKPVYEGQDQCCVEGFERKEVAEAPLPPRPTAYEDFLRRQAVRQARQAEKEHVAPYAHLKKRASRLTSALSKHILSKTGKGTSNALSRS